jgi:uncharacterized protein
MKTMLGLLVWVLVELTGLAAERNIADRPSTSVSGTAVAHPRADLIVWTLGISDSDKDMLAAKARNDHRVKAILGLRKELDLSESDFETGQVSIHREYEQDEHGHQGPLNNSLSTEW